MGKQYTRREILNRSAAGAVVAKDVRGRWGRRSAAQSVSVTGQIVDAHATPVGNARVELFDAAARSKVAEAETDANGEYTLSFDAFSADQEPLVIARKEVVRETAGTEVRNDWFTTQVYGSSVLETALSGRIPIDKELLVYPTQLTDGDTSLGVVTVWRHVGNPYSDTQQLPLGIHGLTQQIFSIEVTNAVGGRTGRDPHEIHSERYDLSSGMFSLTFPEDAVLVDYGSQDDIDVAGGVTVKGTETQSPAESPGPAVAWHPLRTGIPAYEASRKLSSNTYAELSSADAESLDEIEDELKRAIGVIPGVGAALNIVDSLTTGFGDPWENSAELTEPMPPETRNPNTHDTAMLGWQSDNVVVDLDEASVVFRVPVEFQYESEDRSSLFVCQANWEFDTISGVGSGSGVARVVRGRGPSGRVEQPESTPDAVEISGTILEPGGAPAAANTLAVFTVEDQSLLTMVTTREDGSFSYTAPTDWRHDVQYYQLNDADTDNDTFEPQGPVGPRDGTPDLFAVTQLQPTQSRDIGSVELPEAYPVEIDVVDQSGQPVGNARVAVEHYNDEADAGITPYPTNADGRFVWDGSETTGMELRGDVRVEVRPPADSDRFADETYTRELAVTDPTRVEVALEGAGDDSAGLREDFSEGSFDEYVVIAGSRDDWNVEEKIDGNSLHASRGEGKAFAVLDPNEYSWGGDRDVRVDFVTEVSNYKKNAYLVVGDGNDRWFGRVGVQGNGVNIFYDEGSTLEWETVEKGSVTVEPGEVHTLALRIRGDTITLSLEGTDQLEHAHSDAIGAGTVGVGTTGGIPHETWFDNLTVNERG
ncbi:carboxypeptidase regulatory-like domain-containing protein [Halostella sp. JP-L12]|uniref:carboxypeptidase-like regulatory domain-containing protein n=1 Tax=Halostella TaxID=1843185 RepID=UPI000EF81794|nr:MULTISPECIES: carboxypeptidase-like regulatory domain-containing protein [Halostella]NHN46603.1 carboxypeptidase regulatory-like domain-containing protein [Halostella sp. JP-L12]